MRTPVHASRFTILFRRAACVTLALALASLAAARGRGPRTTFTNDWRLDTCAFADAGRNRFLVLEPGHELQLAGETKDGWREVRITVLDETEAIDGVNTRVVEEEDRLDGVVVGLTHHFLALCTATSDVVHFGAEVTLNDEGPGHAGDLGSWRAGSHGARPGILMPGTFMLGARYAISMAPEVAEERAENVAMDVTMATPAGTFEGAIEVVETTPLEPDEQATKVYAEGIGLIADESLRLVSWTPAPTSP